LTILLFPGGTLRAPPCGARFRKPRGSSLSLLYALPSLFSKIN
jgi:hypothetical protein